MTQSFEERWGIYSNGEIVDPIPFIRTEIELARKEERERVLKLLDMSIFNDPDYYQGSKKLSHIKELIQKINQDD